MEYSDHGTYVFECTATDDDGNTASGTVEVEVQARKFTCMLPFCTNIKV